MGFQGANMAVEFIAARDLIGEAENGERFPISLQIGKPYRASDVDWACPVAIEGLRERLPDMHGIDSFQALLLAIYIARQVIEDFLERVASCIGRSWTNPYPWSSCSD